MVKSAQKVKRKRLELSDGSEDWAPFSVHWVNVCPFLYIKKTNKQTETKNKQTNKLKQKSSIVGKNGQKETELT